MNIKLETGFFVLLALALIWGATWAVITEKRLKKFFLGKKGKDLEDTILFLEKEIERLNKARENLDKEVSELRVKQKKSVRGLETVRFNPFPDQGGNQSFAIGMLNEEGDGVVISSLYARDRMSVFAKPVKNGKSTYELTEEEREALEKAKL